MPFGSIPLNDRTSIPLIAYGTGSKWKGHEVTEYVEQAFEAGFCHVDTAAFYGNEESVGTALRESGLRRDELYVTGKFSGGAVREEAELSLKKLGISYFDLYLIHDPRIIDMGDLANIWRAFEKIKADGLAKSIGVSNFTVQQLQTLLKTAKVVPAANQISFNPYNYAQNFPLLKFCAKHGIAIEAYSPLAPITRSPGGPVDKPVQRAANRIGATPAQVLMLWVHSKKIIIVTTSSKKDRLKEYLSVADLPPLTPQEISDIERAGAKGPSLLSRQNLVHRVVPLMALTLLGFGMHLCIGSVYP